MTKEFKLGKHYGWSVHAHKIYDETYDKVYRHEMARFSEMIDAPRTWYEEAAQELATNMAEDAVDNYLDTPDK